MKTKQEALARLEAIKKKEQFLVNSVGEQKLLETIDALENISTEINLKPEELLSITELYRLEKLLPVL